jgi:4-hydroxybenzoate polyprenyltransferase
MKKFASLIALLRPHQWLKNSFVFAGLVFSQTWSNGPLVQRILLAFAAFCCASSLVYILNDWRDRASDALHPVKRLRPLASGAVSQQQALMLALILLLLGLLFAWGNRMLLLILGVYIALNLAYSWKLKHIPVVDVSIIASGFMLRLLAGTLAVSIPPSRWLLLTGLFLALFLGFSKRKAETFQDIASQRAVLTHYTTSMLDTFMAITMTSTLLTYSLYATSFEAQAQHGERLIFTVPVVVFGLLRYTYQVHKGRGEDLARELLQDRWILLALAAWVIIFMGHRF